MDKVNVQILFTVEEYQALKAKADKLGTPVSMYIKGQVLPDDELNNAYQKLLQKVAALDSGVRFNIKMLFGVEWTMSRGTKLNLGRTYYNRVQEGFITNVIVTGKDSANIMWYEKK